MIAVIPARGGSKGIPHKNLREVGGRPLIGRAVDTCVACPAIDLVVVSTDDDAIAGAARAAGAEIVERPAELSGDAATSESALLHALTALRDRDISPDVLVFVQATSPFIDPDDIAGAVEQVRSGELDVVFAAVETYEFLWAREPLRKSQYIERTKPLGNSVSIFCTKRGNVRAPPVTSRRYVGWNRSPPAQMGQAA